METYLADVDRISALLLDSLKVSTHSTNDKHFKGSAATTLGLCGSLALFVSFASLIVSFAYLKKYSPKFNQDMQDVAVDSCKYVNYHVTCWNFSVSRLNSS